MEDSWTNFFIFGIFLSFIAVSVDRKILPRTSSKAIHFLRVIFLYIVLPFILITMVSTFLLFFNDTIEENMVARVGGGSLLLVFLAWWMYGTKRLKD